MKKGEDDVIINKSEDRKKQGPKHNPAMKKKKQTRSELPAKTIKREQPKK